MQEKNELEEIRYSHLYQCLKKGMVNIRGIIKNFREQDEKINELIDMYTIDGAIFLILESYKTSMSKKIETPGKRCVDSTCIGWERIIKEFVQAGGTTEQYFMLEHFVDENKEFNLKDEYYGLIHVVEQSEEIVNIMQENLTLVNKIKKLDNEDKLFFILEYDSIDLKKNIYKKI